MTTYLSRVLDDAGVKVDLTVEPGLPGTFGLAPRELTTGWIEDTRAAPTHPYRPSRDDFRVPDAERSGGLLMIPLTRGLDIEVARDPDRLRPRGRWETLILWDDPARFRNRLVRCLAKPALTHLAFAIRAELPIRDAWPAFEANLAELCRHPVARERKWCTASEAGDRLSPDAKARPKSDHPRHDGFRAGLWADGAEDPGYLEGAEVDALDLLSETAGGQDAVIKDLTARLDAATAEVADLRMHATTETA